MNVLFVINNLYLKGNGLCASARRTIGKLREAGLTVEAISGPNPDPQGPQPKFLLKDLNIPVIEWFCKKQGYQFADTERDIIKQAVQWADVVHIEEPFDLQNAVATEAIRQGKAVTGTYHLHPENLFASAGLEKSHFFNDSTMRIWKETVFDKCQILQCPTQNVKDRLNRWHYKSELRVISNGLVLEELFHPDENTPRKRISDAKYQIISIGRLSAEKDYITLLKAMRYSKHAKEIQLILAGRGPKEKQLFDYSCKLIHKRVLKYAPRYGFFALEELQQLATGSDLFIHCASIEVEGLSCMEAIQTGLVPVIASGKLTATSQFALSQRSIYPAKNPRALAQRIDYWLENEEARKAEAERYKGLGEEYDINKSIRALIQMFEDAIARRKEVANIK